VTGTSEAGWVYILTNPAMPGLVKIGHTARRPERRAAELTAATGVPAPFTVAWAHPVVGDHEALEGIVHGQLARCRARHNREFFRCSVPVARQIIEREAAALLLPWWRAWLHRLLHPAPSPKRSARRSGHFRRTPDGDAIGLLMVIGGGAFVYVLMFQPGWVPFGLMQQLHRLPQL
jgi:hypothetical protein